MPSIPILQQQTRASGAGLGPGPTSGRGLMAVGDAMGDLGRAGMQSQLRDIELQEKNAAAEASAELMTARSFWIQQMQDRQQNAAPGAEGFTPQLLKDFDADMAERVAKGRTKGAQQYLRENLARVRESTYDQALRFEALAGAKHREGQLAESVNQAKTAAEFNPADFDELASQIEVSINASGATAQRADELRGQARGQLAEAAVLGMIRANPKFALQELNNEKSKISSVNALVFEDRQRLRGAAEAEIRRLESEARARAAEARERVDTGFQDAIAAKAYGLPATMPSRAQYAAAYGADGEKLYARDSQMFSIYDVVGAAVAMPPEAAAAELQRFAPQTQAGAATQGKVYESAMRLYTEQRKAFEADPVGQLMRRDPALQEAFAAAFGEGSEGGRPAVEAYVNRARSLQEAAGLPGAALLPEAMANQVAAQLEPNPENPGARAASVAQLEQQWGRHYQDILRQVQPKLTGYAAVLTNMPPDAAIRLDQAIAQKGELEKAIPGTASKDIGTEVERGMADFALSLADNADAETQIGQHMEAAELLAKSYVARGMAPSKAGQLAVQNVLSSYQFKAQRGDQPVLRIPDGVDADAVAAGAEELRSRVAREGGLKISSNALSDQGAAASDLAATIQRRGYWITNEDGTGLVLRIPHRSGMGYVYREDGTRVEYPWDVVASEHRPVDAAPYLYRGPME